MPNRLPTQPRSRWLSMLAFTTVAAAWAATLGARHYARRHRGLGVYEGLHLER